MTRGPPVLAKAAVVPQPGAEFDPAKLIELLVPRMPRFAIPRYVKIWDALPKTEATARIQKAKIREAGVPTGTWNRMEPGVQLPR